MTDGNENGLGAVPPWPQTVTQRIGITFHTHHADGAVTITQQGTDAWQITEPQRATNTATQRRAQRRALRRLEIHPLMADNTEEPKPAIMSDDAKAFWRGDHFYFDCQ